MKKNAKESIKYMQNNKRGITLVALVVTIVVLLILAGVTINGFFGDEGIINKTLEAQFKSQVAQLQEEYELFLLGKELEISDFEQGSVSINKEYLAYNNQEIEGENIYTVFANEKKEFLDNFEIIKGEIIYFGQDEKKKNWAQELGITISPYVIVDGVLLSANENLNLVDEETGTLALPTSVKAIGEGAFANVEGLKIIIIPSTVEEIQKNAFNGNKTLEQVIFRTEIVDGMEQGTEIIGEGAFTHCSNLKTITMPNTVTKIGESVFFGCNKLSEVVLSDQLTVIPNYTFYNCTALENITIPEVVTTIEGSVFNNCTNLKYIVISKNVNSIVSGTFSACKSLETIEIDPENQSYIFEDGILMKKDKTEIIYITKTAITGNTFIIPSTIEKLGSHLIDQHTQIQKVIIPESVTSIDAYFLTKYITEVEIAENNPNYVSADGKIYNKDKTILYLHYLNTENVTLEEGIKQIGIYAFRLCTNLKQITLPESLEYIAAHAFFSILDSINIGKNVSFINNLAFYEAKGSNITIDSKNPYYMTDGNAIYNKEKTILRTLLKKVTEFEIPYGVEEIDNGAFHNQNQMTSVTIPETVKKIGSSFNYCTSLTKIEIPSSVETISTGCFNNSSNLKQIIINKEKGSIVGSPWGCMYGEKAVTWTK